MTYQNALLPILDIICPFLHKYKNLRGIGWDEVSMWIPRILPIIQYLY